MKVFCSVRMQKLSEWWLLPSISDRTKLSLMQPTTSQWSMHWVWVRQRSGTFPAPTNASLVLQLACCTMLHFLFGPRGQAQADRRYRVFWPLGVHQFIVRLKKRWDPKVGYVLADSWCCCKDYSRNSTHLSLNITQLYLSMFGVWEAVGKCTLSRRNWKSMKTEWQTMWKSIRQGRLGGEIEKVKNWGAERLSASMCFRASVRKKKLSLFDSAQVTLPSSA